MTELQVYQMLFGITLGCNIGLSIYLYKLHSKLKSTEFILGLVSALRF